jgi:signal transduction histidine kinase
LATLLLIAVVLMLIFQKSFRHGGEMPEAERGVFDMRQLVLPDDKGLNLDGEWEFYWGELLTPEAFPASNGASEPQGYFPMPRTWTGFELNGERLGVTGQATFRLQLLPNPQYPRLQLRLFDIHEAYRLWANGELIAMSGVPGFSAMRETPGRSLKIVDLVSTEQPIELILQVSNYHYRLGGLIKSIAVALPGVFEAERIRTQGLSFFVVGWLMIMAFYHFELYLFRKRDPAPLFFGLYCLCTVGFMATSNSSYWIASTLFPQWSPASTGYFSLACFICWDAFLFRFMRTLYPQEIHRWLIYVVDGRILVFLTLLLLKPGPAVYIFSALCLIQMILLAFYYLVRSIYSVRRGRRGAEFILIGLASLFIAALNDSLVQMGIIQSTYLAGPAICFFVLTNSLALSKRFSQTFAAVEQLSKTLEHKNQALEKEMETRNQLEQKVINISEEERRSISHELHDGLCQELTGAKLQAYGLAFNSQDHGMEQALTKLAERLEQSTDAAYKTARGLWPVEHDPSKAGPSLDSLVQDIARTSGIAVTLERHIPCEACHNRQMTTLYRIAQEALANAAKHAQATHIWVTLDCCDKGRIELQVADDGIGRVAAANGQGGVAGGLGLSIMAHRAELVGAKLSILDRVGGGTCVRCTANCKEIEQPSAIEKKE